MPITNNMGQSKCTPQKHEDYRHLLKVHMTITKVIMDKHRTWAAPEYMHFDINPGDGSAGSPLITTGIANSVGIPYRAVFIELDDHNATALKERMADNPRVVVEHGDHHEVLPRYITNPPVKDKSGRLLGVFGSLFSDGNGTLPPWELLTRFSEAYPKIDLIIYLAATTEKRARTSAKAQRNIDLPYLNERIESIGKTNWIVRESQDKHGWTFLVGTNWDAFPYFKARKLPFWPVASEQGQSILHRLTYTHEERQHEGQIALPFDEPPYRTYEEYLNHPIYQGIRAQAIARSGGICERCKERPVTEVHHVKYPAWGTFEEDASGLLAVCHVCHCEIHDKET